MSIFFNSPTRFAQWNVRWFSRSCSVSNVCAQLYLGHFPMWVYSNPVRRCALFVCFPCFVSCGLPYRILLHVGRSRGSVFSFDVYLDGQYGWDVSNNVASSLKSLYGILMNCLFLVGGSILGIFVITSRVLSSMGNGRFRLLRVAHCTHVLGAEFLIGCQSNSDAISVLPISTW